MTDDGENSDEPSMDLDEVWHDLMTADVLLNEAAIKMYGLGKDGPDFLRYECELLEASIEKMSKKVNELMQQVISREPLSEDDKGISRYVEENARLRAEVKKLRKKDVPPST